MISEALLDIIVVHASVSVLFGVFAMLSLVSNKSEDPSYLARINKLILSIFLILEVAMGAAVGTGMVLHKFTDLF